MHLSWGDASAGVGGWRFLRVFCFRPTCFSILLLVVMLVNTISKLTVRSVHLLLSLILLLFPFSLE